jgi:hypothetical protein
MAALLAGQSINEVARTFKLSTSVVSSWNAAATAATDGVFEPKQKAALGDLLLAYLAENLTTLSFHARAFREAEWLYKHSPADAAVLHGVMVDKAIRILAAHDDAPTGDSP